MQLGLLLLRVSIVLGATISYLSKVFYKFIYTILVNNPIHKAEESLSDLSRLDLTGKIGFKHLAP